MSRWFQPVLLWRWFINQNKKIRTSSIIKDHAQVENKDEADKQILSDNEEYLEGGWGYAVVVAMAISQFMLFGPLGSFGILFHDFLNQDGNEKQGAVMFIIAMNSALLSAGFGSFATTFLLKRLTVRQSAFCAVIITLSGDLFALLMTEPYHLILNYGLLRGFGFGILVTLSFTTLNTYFKAKRTSMVGVGLLAQCIGAIVFPSIIARLLQTYGFRGSMLIMFGVTMHLFIAAALMVPHKMINASNTLKYKKIYNRRSGTHGRKEKFVSLLENKDLGLIEEEGHYSKSEININHSKVHEGKLKRIVRYLNLQYLTDPIFVNIAFGLSMTRFTMGNFKLIEPLLLSSYGLKESEIAICITAGGIAETVSRLFMAILAYYVKIPPRFAFFLNLCLVLIARLAFLLSQSFVYLTIMTVVIEAVKGWLEVLFPIVVADYVTLEQFPAAYGLLVLVSGFIVFVCGAITGFIHAATGIYAYTVYALCFGNALNIALWSIEYIYKRCVSKRKI